MKNLILIDNRISNYSLIDKALEKVSMEFETIDVKITNEHKWFYDLDNIDWIHGDKDYWHPSWKWLTQNTKYEGYTSIIFIVDESNWSTRGYTDKIYGWHLGKHNSSQAIFIRYNKGRYLFSTFYEEIAHFLNDIIFEKLGVDLNKKYGFDVDWGIVHGNHYLYTRWKYRKYLSEIKPYLQLIFNGMKYIKSDNYLDKRRWAIINDKRFWIGSPQTVERLGIKDSDFIVDDLTKYDYVGQLMIDNPDEPQL